MHRNTLLLVVFLGMFAALVVTVNVNRIMRPADEVPKKQAGLTGLPASKQAETDPFLQYTSSICGFSLTYPTSLTLVEDATGSAALVNVATGKTIVMTCEKDIPRPPLPPAYIETVPVHNAANTATVSAKLYHDRSPKDGTEQDALIFYYPKMKKDVFIAGFGAEFNQVRSSLLLQ